MKKTSNLTTKAAPPSHVDSSMIERWAHIGATARCHLTHASLGRVPTG